MTDTHTPTGPDTRETRAAAGTFDEWRVSGEMVNGAPSYEFTWSPLINPHLGNSETAAREFYDKVKGHEWRDGPYLHHRTVTLTEWEQK